MRGGAMRRIRLSTLMLLIVIAALCAGLIVQDRRAARRETELKAKLDSRGEAVERLMQLVKGLQSQRSNVGKPSVTEGDSK
jgi:hypothetical protein